MHHIAHEPSGDFSRIALAPSRRAEGVSQVSLNDPHAANDLVASPDGSGDAFVDVQSANDAIDRAVKRGAGETGGANFESIIYEGYAPGGVALLIDVLTDNRNRSSSDVRAIFSKLGGSMAEPGSVAWQFSRRGVIYIDGSVSEDDAMAAALEAGADDVARDGDDWRVLTDPSDVWDVKSALEAKGVKVTSAENTMVAGNTVPVTDVEDAKKILKIMDGLEDNDDVQDVYANFDMSEEIMQAVN